MRTTLISRSACIALLLGIATPAHATYWNAFNIEGETSSPAQYATYTTLSDMLTDQNRTGLYTPNPLGFGANIVDGGSDGVTYWSLFNVEGESSLSAQYATYASLDDMLTDQNRTALYTPDLFGFGVNIVGSGFDGNAYWSLFNVEGEMALSAQYATYATLSDMLTDQNRTGLYTPDSLGFGINIVDGGSDGTTYWSLFNVEGETSLSAQYATYASLNDMLTDQNRTGLYTPNAFGFGTNIVGGGSDVAKLTPIGAVPEPSTWALMIMGFAIMGAALRRRRSDHIAATA